MNYGVDKSKYSFIPYLICGWKEENENIEKIFK